MKKPLKVTLISGLAVAAAAVVASIGFGVGGAARTGNMSQHRAPGTEMVSGLSNTAPAADASSSQLPTKPVGAPSGSIEYAAAWKLDSSSGSTLSITITGPGNGCTTLGYVQVSETSTTVTVTPQVIFDQKRGEDCAANLQVKTGQITLAAPLADRTLIHGETTVPKAAG